MQQLKLDPIGVAEEDRVIRRGIGVLTGSGLDLSALIAQPPGTFVHDLARGDIKTEVMNSDCVAVKRHGMCIRSLLAKPECRDS
jgi:hypothetical protein